MIIVEDRVQRFVPFGYIFCAHKAAIDDHQISTDSIVRTYLKNLGKCFSKACDIYNPVKAVLNGEFGDFDRMEIQIR